MTQRNFLDIDSLAAEAQSYVGHPQFDTAMQAFCGGLADFHSIARSRRTGVVDTITWAVAVLVLYLDAHAPHGANTSKIVAICAEGGLGGATAVRNAIALLRQGGMIAVDHSPGAGRAHRLHPTPGLIETMQDNLAVRFAAMEHVIAWPKPAEEWARTDGVLEAFVRGNVEAYRCDRYTLFQDFPEIRVFMDRHCGYIVLMESLAQIEISPKGGSTVLTLSEIAQKFTISRAHIRKLFAAAAAREWLCFESGGRLMFRPEALARYRLWFGYEFAWARRLVEM